MFRSILEASQVQVVDPPLAFFVAWTNLPLPQPQFPFYELKHLNLISFSSDLVGIQKFDFPKN